MVICQPKLEIGSVDDPLELEADRVAEQVMRMPDELDSLSAGPARVSRKCACQDDDEPELLQAKPAGPLPGAAPAAVHHTLQSPGRPLDSRTREFFEPRFGRDFSDVRIHTDSTASDSARSIHALAYTVGHHVVLADGQFSPNTGTGRRLLAHELAHVVQQGAAGVVRRAPKPDTTWRPGPPRVQRQATTSTNPAGDISHQQQENDALRQPVPGGLPSGVSIQRRQDVRCGTKFVDAELSQEGQGHATLTLSVRSRFVFLPDGGPWSMAEQKRWQETFIRKVTEKWSFKHYLEPTGLCRALPVPRVAVNVRCVPVPAGAKRHLDVIVYRSQVAPERSSVKGGGTVSVSGVDGGRPKPASPATMLAGESDIDADIGGYVTAEHEFGHALGLDHITCPTNDDKCYGRGDEAADVMGNGPTIGARDYEPFAQLLSREFAPGCTWKVTAASAPPKNKAPLVWGVVGGALGLATGALLGSMAGGLLGGLLGGAIGGLALGGAAALLGYLSGTQL